MKRIIAILLLMSIYGGVKAQTTLQEYNYCRNSLLSDIEAGKPIMKDYFLEPYTENDAMDKDGGEKSIKTILFNYTSTNQTKCILFIAQSSKVPPITIVVPYAPENSIYWKNTLADLNHVSKDDPELGSELSIKCFKLLSDIANRLDEYESKRGLKLNLFKKKN